MHEPDLPPEPHPVVLIALEFNHTLRYVVAREQSVIQTRTVLLIALLATKRKAVFTAEADQLDQIQELVRKGKYRTASQFLREAIDEKLDRLRRHVLTDEVVRYCAEGHASEDEGLIAGQAFDAAR